LVKAKIKEKTIEKRETRKEMGADPLLIMDFPGDTETVTFSVCFTRFVHSKNTVKPLK